MSLYKIRSFHLQNTLYVFLIQNYTHINSTCAEIKYYVKSFIILAGLFSQGDSMTGTRGSLKTRDSDTTHQDHSV